MLHQKTMASGASPIRISLAGAFEITKDGRRVNLSPTCERLLALLALSDRPIRRSRLAGLLWLDATEQQAAGNLRTTLWRLQRQIGTVIDARGDRLSLAEGVEVDLGWLSRLCNELIAGHDQQSLSFVSALLAQTELLPDWDDDWLVADRERYRLLRLAALEAAALRLLERGDLHLALTASLAAAQSEPLRESSRRLLIRVHLADGNAVEAFRTYSEYRDLLDEELGLTPTPAMERLLETVGPSREAWNRGAVTARRILQ